VGGLVCTCLRAAIFGQTLVILTPDGFRNLKVVQGFWDIARRFDITNVIATPTTAAALHADPKADHVGHRIHTFSCGGSTIPTELLHAFHRRFGLYLRELWGMTEFHGVTTGHPNDGSQPAIGSVGRRFAYHQVKAVLLEDGRFVREAAPGEKGILIASGACIGDGYLPEAMSEQLFVKGMPDGKVWATTGDIGTVDETGHVWVHGREKDLIVRGGHKIDPRSIEEVLQQHPAVQLSAAIGQPHATRGEMPIAYVQPRTNAQVSADELIAFCKERIVERAAVPVEITLLPAMPMTAVGKIAKPALRLDALKRVAHDVAIRAIGVDSVAGIRVDESGKRPTVIVALRAAAEPAAEVDVEDKLRSAFMGFEFDVRAEILPVREAA
jgi:fatty-acyl-CoA synthase